MSIKHLYKIPTRSPLWGAKYKQFCNFGSKLPRHQASCGSARLYLI